MKTAMHIYNLLLSLYPRSYQKAFRAQMQQTFIDSYKDVEESEGHESIRFWLSTIADEAQNIARQHADSLTEGNNFLKITCGKLLVSTLLFIPLYAAFGASLVKLSLALPHPHLSGIAVLIALSLLLVLPGILSVTMSYLVASAFVSLFPKRKAMPGFA